jgi:hypothetical protein
MVTPYKAGTAGVPDPADTGSSTDASGALAPGANYDDLSMLGVPSSLQNIEIPWGTQPVAKVPSAGFATPMIPAHEGPRKYTYENAVRYLYGEATNNPSNFSQIQLTMAAGGFMGKTPAINPGTPDDETRNAWNEVLRVSMRTGKTPDEVMQDALDANGGLDKGLAARGLGPNAAKSAQDIGLTHPDDIRAVAKKVSMQVLGKGWDAKKLDSFVQSYQAMESAQGQAAQGKGATVTQAPSMESAAESAARASDPVAAGGTDWDNAAKMMLEGFKQLGGGPGL